MPSQEDTPSGRKALPQFTRSLWLTLGAFIVVAVIFGLYVVAEKRIDRANETRVSSLLLADELRQSSDDLTRMVRSYVITGDPVYKRHYQEILDIRDGRSSRPVGYEGIYWDLVFDDLRPTPSSGQKSALLDRMREAGFTEAEFARLAQAKANSDALTAIEFAAMRLLEAGGPAAAANRAKAIAMLHDATYHQAKAGIMRPIGEFYRLQDVRTQAAVHQREHLATALRVLFVLFGLLLVAMLWLVYRSLQEILGGPIQAVHAHIARLGSGDFSAAIPVAENRQDSVLGWLSATRSQLARIDAERRDVEVKNHRLTQLYAALSQCNQAIVRCTSEAELFAQICRDVVKLGGIKMAWIGLLDAATGTVVPAASHGAGIDYLDGLHLSIRQGDVYAGGPSGTAMREDRAVWCQDFQHDPATAPWHERAAPYGWGSSAALPLHRDGAVIGVFNLYAEAVDGFDEAARNLLLEMAVDIDFAMNAFEREARIEYLARHDVLTGLPNRSQLDDHLRFALSLAKRASGGGHLALMFLDLDHFKDINDSLGHSVGDALLIELTRRMRALLREEDTLSRLGGDEFILLLPGADAHGAAQVAEKLLAAIARPCRIEPHDLSVTASLGIALYPADGVDLETLSKNADTAMYRAKQEGRQGYRFFTAGMQARAARNLDLLNGLRQTLERGQLSLHYQPQIALCDGRVIGAEALLRWTHPELGAVSPAEFIPVAEDSGLILPIGEWVLRQVVQQAMTWRQQGLPALVMAVNLSAVQFRHADLPALVARILEETGLLPEYLELELTESVAMHDAPAAIAVMNQLYEHGIRLSIDDFGTGYSSLSHLKKFKVYKLKIDQSFVRDISSDPEDRAIVAAIINMAQSLGLTTLAEGVETEAQRAFLHEQGCAEAQGYLFSRPLPAEAFAAFLYANNSQPG
jgi:diguanylate cyclase (GGDEF)-like protein